MMSRVYRLPLNSYFCVLLSKYVLKFKTRIGVFHIFCVLMADSKDRTHADALRMGCKYIKEV